MCRLIHLASGELKEGSEGNQTGPPSDPKGVFTLTRKACEFIEANQDRPFFCYLAHHAIHGPLQGSTGNVGQVQGQDARLPAQQRDVCRLHLRPRRERRSAVAEARRTGFGARTRCWCSPATTARTQQSSQEPLRGNKGSYYEGGIREPFIVRWPGVTRPGSRCDVPVINVDLFPTFLAAAGAPVPDGKLLDGESLLPLLNGDASLSRQAIFWHFPGYLNNPVIRGRELDVRTGFRSRPVTVVHKGDWKLHLYHEEWQLDGGRAKLAENHAVELYNLKDDIGERNNLANENIPKRDELLADVLAWHRLTGALVPHEPNPKYQPDAIPTGGTNRR